MHKQLNCHATENTSSIQGRPHISLIPKGIFKPQLVTHFKQNGKTQNKICPLLVYYSGIWHEQRMQVITQIKREARNRSQDSQFPLAPGTCHVSIMSSLLLWTVPQKQLINIHLYIYIFLIQIMPKLRNLLSLKLY